MTDYAKLLQLVNPIAEETTIKGLCHGDMQTAFQLIDQLDASDYHDQRYQILFMALQNLIRGIEPIDTKAIVTECRSLIGELKLKVTIAPELIDNLVGDTDKAASYANTVKRLSWLRKTADFAEWLVKELQMQPDPNELFTSAQERFQILQPKQVNQDFIYGWDTIRIQQNAIAQRIKEFEAGETVRFDWPWASWNNIVRPLRPGMLGILAAADGMGKTTFLEIIAEHWAKREYHVVYVHLEDSIDYKFDRRTARHALVPIESVEDGSLTREELRRIQEADRQMASLANYLHYYYAGGKSMVEIISNLESRVREGVCQVVVFDYLDKVQPTRGQSKMFGDNTWERQAHDVEKLKNFAEKCNVPVFSATQGNKDMQENGVQTRKSIQGSGQKSQKSQLVIILTRDIVGEGGLYDSQNTLLAEAGEYSPIVNVRIDKQNRGKTGGFKQFLVGKYFTVRDIDRRPLN